MNKAPGISLFISALSSLAGFGATAATAPPAGLENAVMRAEYQFSRFPDGRWSAPNRAHDLRLTIDAGGVELTSRTHGAVQSDEGFALRFVLRAWGREGDLVPLGDRRIDGRSEEVTLDGGSISEWYRNDSGGIEQGFTLHRRPHGAEGKTSVFLEMKLDGLIAYPGADDQGVLFKTATGKAVLRYENLVVTDAASRRMPAEIEVLPGKLRIRIHDGGAVYPITVDPLITSAVWTTESNQDGASLGWSVAVAGDVNGDGYSDEIVGAPFLDGSGKALLFLGGPSGPAATPAWTGSGSTGSRFGYAVASAGDVNGDGYDDVLVGEPLYISISSNEGRAYLFLGSASGLSQTPAWILDGSQPGAQFGRSLSTAGDVNGDGYADVLVGAPFYDSPAADSGRAFLYMGSASAAQPAATWYADSFQGGAHFGEEVSSAGDVNGDGYADVIIGAPLLDGTFTDEGRVFVWHGGALGLGANGDPGNATWLGSGVQQGAFFGDSVAGIGDVNGDGYSDILVGAYGYEDSPTESGEGRVFAWYGGPGGLGPFGTPVNTDRAIESNQMNASLGWSVAAAGDVNGDGFADVMFSALDFTNDQAREGRVWVYLGSAAGIAASPYAVVESNQTDSQFGISVAGAGDCNGDGWGDVIVGANLFDNGNTNEGRAFVYAGNPDGMAAQPSARLQQNQPDAWVGFSVASAGDVNGDGYADVIVGAPAYDNGHENEGIALVYYGGPTGIGAAPNWLAESNQAGAFLGVAVAGIGDVNGDGYDDVAAGAHQFDDNTTPDEGRVFVWYGGPGGLGANGNPGNAAWFAHGGQTAAYLGASVARAGDVNGDGFSDIIIGSPGRDGDQVDEGQAFVYLGSALGLGASPVAVLEGNQPGAQMGWSVAGAGDVNGDGRSDVIVGVAYWDDANGNADSGQARVHLGTKTGINPVPAWTADANQAGAAFGASVSSAGDVNGDGRSDVLVGAPDFDAGQPGDGRAFLYFGTSSGVGSVYQWTASGQQFGSGLGRSVASAGDVNGDGYGDVIVGAPSWDDGQPSEGRAWVYLGWPGGLATTSSWTFDNDVAGSLFGRAVAGAGDVNGDGFADIIVGSYGYNDGIGPEGRAWIFLGNGGDGLDRAPRQFRSSGSAPIAHLGISDSETSFRLIAVARSAAGRARVRLEWEVKPLGAPFNGSGIQAGTVLVDTGLPTVSVGSAIQLGEVATGLQATTPYKWRMRVAARNPVFPHSAWISLQYNSITEMDLRTKLRDVDADGYSNVDDCDDNNAAVFVPPTEVANDIVSRILGGYRFSWTSQAASAGPGTTYDIYSGLISTLHPGGNFSFGACVISNLSPPQYDDLAPNPSPGAALYYMIRAQNACPGGSGTYGTANRDTTAAASASTCP